VISFQTINNDWNKAEAQVLRTPIVSKTPVGKAIALSVGIGLAMLSYPVHAAPASGGDTVQGLYEVLLATMEKWPHAWAEREGGRISPRSRSLAYWRFVLPSVMALTE
jgi:hypothetical protein